MAGASKSTKQDQAGDFFLNSIDNGSGLLPPPSFWQRFWSNPRQLVVAAILLLVAFFAGAYFYQARARQPESANLADYLPADAWLFVELDLAPDEWQQLQKTTPALAGWLNNFFLQQGLSQSLVDESQRLAIVGLPSQEGTLWAWLVVSPRPRQLELFLAQDMYLRQLGAQVAVISKEVSAAKAFKYHPGRENIRRPDGASLAYGRLRMEVLAKSLSGFPENQIIPRIASSLLSRTDSDISFAVRQYYDGLVLGDPDEPPVAVLPDAPLSLDLLFRHSNLASAVSSLETALASQPLAEFFWRSFKEKTAADYDLDWSAWRELLDRPLTLALRGPAVGLAAKSATTEFFQAASTDWLLDSSGVLSATEHGLIERTVRNFLARLDPVERTVTLPDGQVAVDLVADPENISAQAYQNKPGSILFNAAAEAQILFSPNTAGWRLSNSPDMDETYDLSLAQAWQCGGFEAESVYLGKRMLQVFAWLQDFEQGAVSWSGGSLTVCLNK